jgi:hypothetical protein
MDEFKSRGVPLLALVLILVLTGCVERTIRITSDPPGALVFLNEEEIGRTPCTTQFTYYGTYDVRLVLDGYEPYLGPGAASAPIYQWPVFDLVAEISPLRFTDTVDWHFDLTPANDDPAMMLDRAQQLRALMRRDLGPAPADVNANSAGADANANAADAEPDAPSREQSPEDE